MLPDPHQPHPTASLPDPICPKCGLRMERKRTRKAFTKDGVATVNVFACLACEEIIQIEGP